jgi:hypothetical protein
VPSETEEVTGRRKPWVRNATPSSRDWAGSRGKELGIAISDLIIIGTCWSVVSRTVVTFIQLRSSAPCHLCNSQCTNNGTPDPIHFLVLSSTHPLYTQKPLLCWPVTGTVGCPNCLISY